MKFQHLLVLAAAMSAVSCKSNKLAGDAANPYDAAANGGYSSGDFYNAPAASGDYAAAYDPAYNAAMNAHTGESASVVPFTDNGSGYTNAPSPAPVAAPKPKVASTPASRPKTVASASKPKPTQSAKPKTVASTTKKSTAPSKSVASTKSSTSSKTTAGTKGGKVIPAVYRPEKKIASSKTATTTKKKATITRVYVVKKGDSLSKIAARNGTSVSTLKSKNKLKGDTIVPGQELTL